MDKINKEIKECKKKIHELYTSIEFLKQDRQYFKIYDTITTKVDKLHVVMYYEDLESTLVALFPDYDGYFTIESKENVLIPVSLYTSHLFCKDDVYNIQLDIALFEYRRDISSKEMYVCRELKKPTFDMVDTENYKSGMVETEEEPMVYDSHIPSFLYCLKRRV